MMEVYQKAAVLFLIVLGFYLFVFRKKKDGFSKEYFELVDSDEFKVKGQY